MKDDLANLVARVTDFAAASELALVPAVPEHDYGPEVIINPEDLDLAGFLELARRIGDGVLYLMGKPFTLDAQEDRTEKAPSHLIQHQGHIGEIRVAFVRQGLPHFWERRSAWLQEWEDLTAEPSTAGFDGTGNAADRLSLEEVDRQAAVVADAILADPAFRAASPGHRRRRAEAAVPAGTDDSVSWRAVRQACERVEQMAEEAYAQVPVRLDELACELLADPQFKEARSAAARKQAAGLFLIPHAGGFSPPYQIREELYARAQELARKPKGGGLF